MAQVHVLIGPNTYALHTERTRWVQGFRQKHGDENLVRLEGTAVSYRELRDEVAIGPFIAQKRLVVLNGLPKGKKGDIDSVLDLLHPDVLLLVVLEAELGKRAKYTVVQKEYLAAAEKTEFPLVTGAALQSWIQQESAKLAVTFEPAAISRLIELVGEDQLLLWQEIQKLALYRYNGTVSSADVTLLSACSMEREIWQLMDYLGAGKQQQALQFAYSLLDRGLSPHALWNTFLWMVALLPPVAGAAAQGESNPWDISRDLKISYPGVKALLPIAKTLSHEQLTRLISQISAADKAVKTGDIRATEGAPEELLALIDQSLLAFSHR